MWLGSVKRLISREINLIRYYKHQAVSLWRKEFCGLLEKRFLIFDLWLLIPGCTICVATNICELLCGLAFLFFVVRRSRSTFSSNIPPLFCKYIFKLLFIWPLDDQYLTSTACRRLFWQKEPESWYSRVKWKETSLYISKKFSKSLLVCYFLQPIRCLFKEDSFKCRQRGSNFRQGPRLRQEFQEKLTKYEKFQKTKKLKIEGRTGPLFWFLIYMLVMLANVIIIAFFSCTFMFCDAFIFLKR